MANSFSHAISAVHSLKQAYEHFLDFGREHPKSTGDYLFTGYAKKIQWIINDLSKKSILPERVRQGIQAEWDTDAWIVPAIVEKCAILNPEQRDIVEEVINGLLKGEIIQFIEPNENTDAT
jgi:hypothetical protein